VLNRYAAEPTVGAHALLMEHLALAPNPAQGLVGGRRPVDLVREHGELGAVLDADLDQRDHALYEVRRILRPRKADPTKLGNAARSVRIRGRGSRGAMDGLLRRLADEGIRKGLVEAEAGEEGILRVYQHRRGPVFPTVEWFFVVAPSLAHEKEHERFDQWWADARRVRRARLPPFGCGSGSSPSGAGPMTPLSGEPRQRPALAMRRRGCAGLSMMLGTWTALGV